MFSVFKCAAQILYKSHASLLMQLSGAKLIYIKLNCIKFIIQFQN